MTASRARAAGAVFRLVQASLFPAAALAYPVFVLRFLRTARRTGTSATVTASLCTRYLQHRLGTRADEPRTQELKRALVRSAGADPEAVVHVAADLLAGDRWERLLAAGFGPARRTVFLWEAVTMYLDLDAVEGVLHRIAGTAAGTAVALDFFSAQLIASRSPSMRWARALTAWTGEPLVLGLDTAPPARERIAAFLAAQGLALGEYRAFGPGSGDRPDAAGFAVAVVAPRG